MQLEIALCGLLLFSSFLCLALLEKCGFELYPTAFIIAGFFLALNGLGRTPPDI